MREVGRLVAVILCVISLYALLGSAFFILGSHWQIRLERSITTLGIATCVCFASGILFTLTESATRHPSLHRTLPVQLYYWGVGATVLLFLLSLYLETYYVPYLYKNQPW
jgi:hypothetical protein